MAEIKNGVVIGINLKDDNFETTYAIRVRLKPSNTEIIAYPLNTNIKRVPIIGESVLVIPSTIAEGNSNKFIERQYYIDIVSIQQNVHHNALPNVNTVKIVNNISNYESTLAGNPNTAGGSSKVNLGKGFIERTDVGSLQPFLGDVLIEGRFGHSLRFGYTPSESDTTQTTSWQASTAEDPITILSNGRKIGGSYNKFIVESVNDDLSSIWLTTTQKVGLTTSQTNIGSGVSSQKNFSNPSIILNSDRIILNSKSDYIILSGKKSVNIATPKWAMDMDKMFTILEGIIQQLADLTSGTATFATGVGPTGPATNVAQVQQLLTQLKQMAQ